MKMDGFCRNLLGNVEMALTELIHQYAQNSNNMALPHNSLAFELKSPGSPQLNLNQSRHICF